MWALSGGGSHEETGPSACNPHQLQGALRLLPSLLAGQLHGFHVLLKVGSQLPSLAFLQVVLGVPEGWCH